MIAALEIGACFVLTAILLTAAMVLSAFQLGCLVTRDDDQRQWRPPPRRACAASDRRARACSR